jgi:eukaryotic-like serine/threonine-protein kinase
MSTPRKPDAERLRQLSALLETALTLPPAAQAQWLRDLPPAQAAFAPKLAAMLRRATVETDEFMREPVSITAGEILAQDDAADQPGDEVGPWRLIRELGAGGMATVWLAERSDGSLRRQVALKLPRQSWSFELKQRMARERDILATLEHPRIARLYDAGVTGASRPWLAMEFVDGSPITVYAKTANLDTRARLALFLPVLQAVQHAHAQLVIHRDIKPANVLVDREGRVKLLDFGIAKLMEISGHTSESDLTLFNGRALTPQYASPEQVAGKTLGTASDVYALGVLLYELLTGGLPYALKRGGAAALEEAILAAQIRRPSQAVRDAATAAALRGDVDTIVMKALQTVPDQRYASAEAFAQDIDRHLKHLPIFARPSSLGYRLRKLWARQKLLLSAGAVASVLALAGVGAVVWQAHQTRQQAERAEAVQALLLDIFRTNSARQGDPQRARAATARELLDIGAQRLQGSLGDQPRTRLALLGVMRSLYVELGLEQRAATFAREAVAITRAEFGNDSLQHLRSLVNLLDCLQHTSDAAERGAAVQAGIELLARLPDRPSPERIEMLDMLSNFFLSTDLPRANALAAQAVVHARKLGDAELLAKALEGAGSTASVSDNHAGAVQFLGEAVALRRRGGALSFDLVRALVQLGQSQVEMLQLPAGEASLRAGVEESTRVNGSAHLDTRQAKFRLASGLNALGRYQDALTVLQPLIAELKAADPPDNFTLPLAGSVMGQTLLNLGRLDDAEAALRQSIEVRDRERPNTLVAANFREDLVYVLLARSRLAEAEAVLADAERIRRANGVVPGQRTWRRHAFAALAAARARGDHAAARANLEQVMLGLQPGLLGSRQGLTAAINLIRVALDEGRLDDAQKTLQQLHDRLRTTTLAGQLPVVEAQHLALCARLAQLAGNTAAAQSLLARAERAYNALGLAAAAPLQQELNAVRVMPDRSGASASAVPGGAAAAAVKLCPTS